MAKDFEQPCGDLLFSHFHVPVFEKKRKWWQFWKKKCKKTIIDEIGSIQPMKMIAPHSKILYLHYQYGNHASRICKFEEERVEAMKAIVRSVCHKDFMFEFYVQLEAMYADVFAGEDMVIQMRITKDKVMWQTGDGHRWDGPNKIKLIGDPNWIAELKEDIEQKHKDALLDIDIQKEIEYYMDLYTEFGW